MKYLQGIITAAALALLAPAFAQPAPPLPAASAATPDVDGEVRKIDKQQGKLTLRHGPIQNLDMPGMTMVFKVADPTMLDSLKVGDKVKFAAENRNGALTVTAIKPAP
ncbi:copper-binding protein [Ideonella sp. YS5]|uniref:copper-binding protein n=1 Tax=Ideonella sp. YS5 TaxID=3453714 RepID=UPI003EE93BDE